MLDFMTYDIDKYYIEALRQYYLKSGDRKSKIVDFTSDQPSPFLNGSETISHDLHIFKIIDTFGGVKPVVFNHKFFETRGYYIQFQVGIILDSQVVDYLNRLVNDSTGSFKTSPIGIATLNLLKRIAFRSKQGWDFNAFFYLAEALGKNVYSEVFPHAHRLSETMLKLQSMDDDVFLDRCEIVPDSDKVAEHAIRHKGASFKVASEHIVSSLETRETVQQMAVRIQASYAALLKIGLLQHQRYDAKKKLSELFEFFHDELGVFGGREAIVGCLHFAGKAGKFSSVEKGSKNVRQKLLGSAWDLQLLRLPETLIQNEPSDPTSIYYVCTADKLLQFLGKMFVVRRVSSIEIGRGHLPSAVGINYDLLAGEVGMQLTKEFNTLHTGIVRTANARVPRDLQQISLIVENMEREMQKFADN